MTNLPRAGQAFAGGDEETPAPAKSFLEFDMPRGLVTSAIAGVWFSRALPVVGDELVKAEEAESAGERRPPWTSVAAP